VPYHIESCQEKPCALSIIVKKGSLRGALLFCFNKLSLKHPWLINSSRGSDAWLNFGHQRMAAVSDISAFNCNGDIEQARRFIHAEVQNILHTLSMVLSCHNALSPISRLPPEIILHIARFLSSVDPLGDSIGWVRVTHVCRRWRHIILENSCLWQDVPVNSRRWASEVIKGPKTRRSQSIAHLSLTAIPLHLRIFSPSSPIYRTYHLRARSGKYSVQV